MAQDIIRRVHSYTEVSPSGTGIRIICRGKLPAGARRKGPVEMYDESSPRYLTITGHVLDGQGEIRDRQAEIEAVHAAFLAVEETKEAKPPPVPDPPQDLDTQQILEKAMTARSDERFAKLWRGEWEGGYRSQSEADMALAGDLAYWCGPDPERIDAMFRQSGLYRGKWERADYRDHTIAKAMDREEFHDWGCQEYDRIDEIVTGGDTARGTGNGELPTPTDNGQAARSAATSQEEEFRQWDRQAKTQEASPELPAWTRCITAAELDALDLRVDYLVDKLLAPMPTVIGGRFKSMKTLVLADLLVSMTSGTKFLGKWQCEQVPVGVWSGESGQLALQNAQRRICKARGIAPSRCELDWHFALPPLYSRKDLDLLARIIHEKRYRAVFIDPAYLCLLDANTATRAGNVFVMGAALALLTAVGQETNCLVGLLHHFGKWTDSQKECTPAELGELSQSGHGGVGPAVAAAVPPRSYLNDGKHLLYLTAGGSLGQAYQLAVDVDEGDMNEKVSGRIGG